MMKASEIGRLLRDAFRCPTCGKSRLLANTAGHRQRIRIEAFDPVKHCACPPPKIGQRNDEAQAGTTDLTAGATKATEE
jgi:hypothetical protein